VGFVTRKSKMVSSTTTASGPMTRREIPRRRGRLLALPKVLSLGKKIAYTPRTAGTRSLLGRRSPAPRTTTYNCSERQTHSCRVAADDAVRTS
jgi:hypothetical protein